MALLSLFALLELVRIGPVDLGIIVGALVLVYYFSLDARAAFIALAAFVVLYFLGRFLPWPFAIGAFVLGWIFQFVGHGYEGRKPAFLTNVIHLLIGPLWICSLLHRAAK